MIYWIFHNLSVVDLAVEPHLEEMRTAEIVNIFRASFGMLDEDLGRVERVTEFALTCNAMLEALLINLYFFIFSIQLVKSVLLLLDCFT